MDITTGIKEKNKRLQTVVILAGVCFFVGRACLVDGLAPVGIALVSVLLLYNTEKLESWQKALITGSTAIILQSVWFLTIGNECSVSSIFFGGVLAAMTGSMFEIVAGLWGGRRVHSSDEAVMMSLAAVLMLMVIGTGAPWLIFPAAIIITVFNGFIGGIAEGLISSFASGMLLFICEEDPLQVLYLFAFAVSAGMFKNSSRFLTGTVVCAIALALQVVEAIPAGVILMLLPEVIIIKIETALREMRLRNGEDNGKNLRELSLLFSSLDNPRSRLAYEFKAMSQLYQQKDMPARQKYRMKQYAASSGYAGSFERCGDCCQWENLPDGRFVMVLSDGMGKGESAAQESNLAVTSVIKMLKAGLDAELVLKLLNAVLMVETGSERYSTMDLAIMDPETREMYFYKIGAAPTVIKRRDKIEVLAAPAMPMGVMEPAGMRCISTIVRPGDQVIMMTDGIVDSKRGDLELEWLRKVLLQIKSKDPQTVCDLILREAAANYGDSEKDDMTVAVVKVR